MAAKIYYGTGKRKTAIARVWLKPGEGKVIINKRPSDQYFGRETAKMVIEHAFELTSTQNQFDLVANVDFQNGPDAVVLRNAAGVLDALGYGNVAGAHFAGEGSAAVDVNAGRSLVRLDPLLDSDDNAVDFSVQETPTPGSLPVAAVPVPPAFFLFMSGIAGLVGIGRRKRLAAAINSV